MDVLDRPVQLARDEVRGVAVVGPAFLVAARAGCARPLDWYSGDAPRENANFITRYGFSNSYGFDDLAPLIMPQAEPKRPSIR
mgnify:CR=1 FL=1